jgi:hypothetical protein
MTRLPLFRALLTQQFALQRMELVVLTVLAAIVAPGALALSATIEQQVNATSTLLNTNGPLTALGLCHLLLTAIILVVRQYTLDSATRHTYASALPIPRGSYAMLRLGTGLTLALLPITGFALGAWLTTSAVAIPEALYAYPFGLTARYALCLLVAYSLMFATQYGAGRHASKIIIVGLVGLLAVVIASQIAGAGTVLTRVAPLLVHPWSPLHVFVVEWRLFDV